MYVTDETDYVNNVYSSIVHRILLEIYSVLRKLMTVTVVLRFQKYLEVTVC